LDKVAQGLAANYPAPNVVGTLNYQTNLRNTFNEDRLGARLDHRLSDNDSMESFTFSGGDRVGLG